MKFSTLYIYCLFVLFPILGHAEQRIKIATAVDVLKSGRNGEVFLVQGQVVNEVPPNTLIINDGTFQLPIVFQEGQENHPYRKGDILLVKGIVYSVLLKGNVLIVDTVQQINKLYPKGATIIDHSVATKTAPQTPKPTARPIEPKPAAPQQRAIPTLPKVSIPTQSEPPIYPDNVPTEKTPISTLSDNTVSIKDDIVLVQGRIESRVDENILILQDTTGMIPIVLRKEHKALSLQIGDVINTRAQVKESETGARTLLALNLARTASSQAAPKPKSKETMTRSVNMVGKPTPPKKTSKIETKPVIITAKTQKEPSAPITQPKANTEKAEKTLEERLETLKRFYEKALITEEEYNAKRMKLLEEL